MIQPNFEGMDPVCPRCKAVVKPGDLDTVGTWKVHARGHAREERNRARRAAYAADPRVRAAWELREAKHTLRQKAKELRQAQFAEAHASMWLLLTKRLPARTPELATVLAIPTAREAFDGLPLPAARRILRKLGLVAAPNTNPILWSAPCANSANN